eukprot:NODE_5780_length_677_cov_263.372727_g5757_i0.p2 GENE.NODE_5780_length_677_cov_263.372727_g5757_i0~~NODE_5780_length_677_cov_263.372727_g5757_i0.p2  ORF type:complete len:157 (+),score=52.90 NODE_5780_length_677_cov_263.372727_g5757_i0:76-546(+)
MSDEEVDLEVQTADAGSSHTYPEQVGKLNVGKYCCIKGRPCKIVSFSTSKNGKHGVAKASITGIDVFTEKKIECIAGTTSSIDCPNLARAEYQLIDIQDGFMNLLDANGEEKNDCKVPDNDCGNTIKKQFDEGKALVVTILDCMGEQAPVGFKEEQ